jgi:hypothetical protein
MLLGNADIVRERRGFVVLLGLCPWLVGIACAAEPVPSIPPSRFFKWDISQEGSVVEQDFMIAEYRGYFVQLEFHHRSYPAVDLEEFRKFTGDGSYKIWTKDADPRIVIARTPAESRRLMRSFGKVNTSPSPPILG